MRKNKKEKSANKGAKGVYFLASIFTGLMLVTLLIDHWVPQGIWITGLENKWQDTLYVYMGGKKADPRIAIAAIDDQTIKKLGWPFPRKYYGQLFRKLKKLGVKVVGVDVLFLDPDVRSPESDREMIAATKEAGNVVHLMAREIKTNPDGESDYIVSLPIKGLGEASMYVATPNVESYLDPDGHVRRILLFDALQVYYDKKYNATAGRKCDKKRCKDVNLASLSSAMYAAYNNIPLDEFFYSRDWTKPVWINFRAPEFRPAHPGRPVSKDGKIEYVDSVFPHISVLDILENRLSDNERNTIKGGIIFVASTVLAAFDHYPSPFYTNWAGVEMHANCLDNLFNNDFLKKMGFGWLCLLVVVCIWIPVFIRKLPPLPGSIIMLGLAIAYAVLDVSLFSKGIAIPFVAPVVSLLIPFIILTVHKAVTEGREKKWIKNTFGQYLSPKVVEVITKDPSKLKLGGDKRDMTMFFLDIAHFTTISEKMDPEKLTLFLNKYLSAFTDVILKNDGVVDKYIGDCIMAFWNAPLDQKEHRLLACFSAIECMEANERLNKELLQGDMPEKPAIRIGLNSGYVVVGNMGSSTRFSYTVIGDEVNLASRLEGANKFFGSRIMASEATYGEAKDKVDARMLGSVRVVGKAVPIKVFELLAKKGELSPERKKMLDAYNAGLEVFYKRDFEAAEKHFQAALSAVPGDAPSQLYQRISQDYAMIPPKTDPDWSVFNLTAK